MTEEKETSAWFGIKTIKVKLANERVNILLRKILTEKIIEQNNLIHTEAKLFSEKNW